MKRILITISLSLIALQILAQSTAIINGKFTNMPTTNFSLRIYAFQISLQPAVITAGNTNADGTFHLKLNLFGAIPLVATASDHDFNLFINPGDSVFITADGKAFYETLKFSGTGAGCNNLLANLYNEFEKTDESEAKKIAAGDKTDPITNHLKVPHIVKYKFLLKDDFFQFADQMQTNKLKMYNKSTDNTFSKEFKKWMEAEINYEAVNMKCEYQFYHTLLNPVEQVENINTADLFKNPNVNDSLAITSTNYIKYLETWLATESSKPAQGTQPEVKTMIVKGYNLRKEKLKGSLRDMLVARHIYSSKTILKNDTSTINSMLRDYKTYNINSSYYSALSSEGQAKPQTPKSLLNPGDPAPDFTVLGADGKNIKLSDYKGKLIYLDVWASWCGPCKREIPYAREMEHQLEGEDIVFLCVSIDRDSSAWRNLLMAQKPVGIHAIDLDPANNISKNYGVASIPRYIIIDKKGIIVDGNAKRPSGGAAEQLRELNKK